MPRKGYKQTPEHRASISRARSGKIYGPRGPPSLEAREKMRASALRRPPMPAETRQKIGEAHRGSKRTAETRARMSASAKIAHDNPEVRKRHSAASRGRVCSAATREYMRQAALQSYILNPARREVQRREGLKRFGSPEMRAHIAEKTRAWWARMDQQTQRERAERFWAVRRQSLAGPKSESPLEALLRGALVMAGIPHETQVRVGRYRLDFLIRDSHLVVECDGIQHETPAQRTSDLRRDTWLSEQLGLSVLRFSGKRLRRDLVGCLNEIQRSMS